MSLNFSANSGERQVWQKIKCDTVDTTNLIVENPISHIRQSGKVGSDLGYLIETPAPDTYFEISKSRNFLFFVNGVSATDTGLSLNVEKDGIYDISINAEVKVQFGSGGYLKLYLGKNNIDTINISGLELDATGGSFNFSSLYKLEAGVNNLTILAKYFGLAGESLGVGTWAMSLIRVSDV